jgi:hypothetical protein
MGKLLLLGPTNPIIDKRLRATTRRLNRIEGLAFEVQLELEKCCRVCPSKHRRELVSILKFRHMTTPTRR